VAIFIGTIAAGYVLTPKPAGAHAAVGYDFIAFYTAGRFVREGRSAELYDLHAFATFQHELALRNGTDLGTAIGPWWNPPFYAWVFVPLAKLSFPTAMKVWVGINLLCAAIASLLLCRILTTAHDASPIAQERRAISAIGLIPIILILSTPFIHAISHAQNTCTSLLLVTGIVCLWRQKRAFSAGLVAALLFYKPQLAAVIGTVLVIDLGRRAVLGIGAMGLVLLGATLALPGSLHAFLHQMPANLHFVQNEARYLWERHVTFKAFWRLLFQGDDVGDPIAAVRFLPIVCSGLVGLYLLRAVIRFRLQGGAEESIGRDRVIAATIAATPLLMPFYFDYDQLLLAVPAVLLAADMLRQRDPLLAKVDRWLLRIWPAHFVWLMVNPDIALLTRVNLTVPLLAGVVALLIVRATPIGALTVVIPQEDVPRPQLAAA
jgi:hypothetical protein